MSRRTRKSAKRVAGKQRRLPEEEQPSGRFERFVKVLEKSQQVLFHVLLFLLFADTTYRHLDYELHLTEKFHSLAVMISAYLG